MLQERSVGSKGVEDPVPESVPELGLGHAAVQAQSRDQHDVVDTGGGRHFEHFFDDPLPVVRASHGGQWQ